MHAHVVSFVLEKLRFRFHPAEWTLMPLRELSQVALACARVNSRTLVGGQN